MADQLVQNFIYCVDSSRPAPAGLGDEKSWFFFYKWGKDVGPTWVPAPEGIKQGDRLWFSVDGELLGYVELTDVRESFTGGREACYDASRAVELPEDQRPRIGVQTGLFSPPANLLEDLVQ